MLAGWVDGAWKEKTKEDENRKTKRTGEEEIIRWGGEKGSEIEETA